MAAVIALLRSHSLRSLGVHSLLVCKTLCHLDLYRFYNAPTHCGRCIHLGDSASRYSNPSSYRHRGADHPTQKHVSTTEGCNNGARYTYPPVKYNNSRNINHSFTDPAYPARVRAREYERCLDVPIETEEALLYPPSPPTHHNKKSIWEERTAGHRTQRKTRLVTRI